MRALDEHLLDLGARPGLVGATRFLTEFVYFGVKNARSCLFVGLFFAAVVLVPKGGVLGMPRYDVLLVVALALQAWMVWTKLETLDEVKAVALFHLVGFALEVFKTSSGIKSWAYPDVGWTKVMGVPLFAGFMYAAVGSFMIQAWRLFSLRVVRHPPYWMSAAIALLIYANFFTHHYIGDYRWYIAACALGLYARCTVIYTPLDVERRMPLLLAFVLIGFFIWLAENISTFFGIWRYPNQLGAWSMVHVGKWSSWSLLVIMTFTMIANLKHIKARINVPDWLRQHLAYPCASDHDIRDSMTAKRICLVLAVLCFLAGAAMLAYASTLAPYTDEALFGQLYGQIPHGDSAAFHKMRGEQLSLKYPLHDFGCCLLAAGVLCLVLWRKQGALLLTPRSPWTLVGAAVLLPALHGIASAFDLNQGLQRGAYPTWADSVVIAMPGVFLLFLFLLMWHLAHLGFLSNDYEQAPLHRAISPRANWWLLAVTALFTADAVMETSLGRYWSAIPLFLSAYFMLSITAARRTASIKA